MNTAAAENSALARTALRLSAWAERWFPDAYIFAALGVVVVAVAAMCFGASPQATAVAFGDGFWSLIPFTMQMVFVVIGGYVVASSPPVARLIDALAGVPKGGRGAVAYVAVISMLASLLNWGFSLVFGGLLVRALARRESLRMDYRAAGAAAYLGLGATWAMGLSSSAAQLQANPASLPKPLLAITGVRSSTTYSFLFLMLGLLLHWRPRNFLDAVRRAVPSTTGVLIQFPLYGGIATILTTAKGSDGHTVAEQLSSMFVHLASTDTYALVIGAYSAILGFFVPSGGGKWLIEAPYVMQAANDLHYHLGWAVQVYNAAEALPNLINRSDAAAHNPRGKNHEAQRTQPAQGHRRRGEERPDDGACTHRHRRRRDRHVFDHERSGRRPRSEDRRRSGRGNQGIGRDRRQVTAASSPLLVAENAAVRKNAGLAGIFSILGRDAALAYCSRNAVVTGRRAARSAG